MPKYITIHQTVNGPNGCESVTYRERRLQGNRERYAQQRQSARETARREWEAAGYVVLTQWDGI